MFFVIYDEIDFSLHINQFCLSISYFVILYPNNYFPNQNLS